MILLSASHYSLRREIIPKPLRTVLLLLLLLGVVGFSIYGWGPARALGVSVRDYLGVRLVEGHAQLLCQAAEESGVDVALLGGIMYMESRGRPGQRSPAGALGLMQLVPAAAEDAARRLGLPEPSEEQLLGDDELNVRLGAAHLAWLLEHRGPWNLEQVLVSYNAGRSRLMGWIEEAGGYAPWRAEQERAWGSGEPTSGALLYAKGVLEASRTLGARGQLVPAAGG
ncbi:MAG TPA: lytic transglycosylase domain-containing protein [Planctomycetes bacterium]|nr:lytic transglycosylase domain-containing protein [Planctomycetota bacterium]HIK59269.1 lytic transglycosylase domain-containing protein [Planctomycetota bacterium]